MTVVVFDLGRVLIDWDPRYMYRRHFGADEAAMEDFLSSVCTMEWHTRCDAGLPMAENVRELATRHPDKTPLIEAWDREWPAMFAGAIEGSVRLLERLDAKGVPLYAITNYPADKWAEGLAQFGFLARFRDILVSGIEKLAKPDPAIFELACRRFGIHPEASLFIDDNAANVASAARLGFTTHHFVNPDMLERDLERLRLL